MNVRENGGSGQQLIMTETDRQTDRQTGTQTKTERPRETETD